jgi:hypothetical protein
MLTSAPRHQNGATAKFSPAPRAMRLRLSYTSELIELVVSDSRVCHIVRPPRAEVSP